jgi:hypothetical protein
MRRLKSSDVYTAPAAINAIEIELVNTITDLDDATLTKVFRQDKKLEKRRLELTKSVDSLAKAKLRIDECIEEFCIASPDSSSEEEEQGELEEEEEKEPEEEVVEVDNIVMSVLQTAIDDY